MRGQSGTIGCGQVGYLGEKFVSTPTLVEFLSDFNRIFIKVSFKYCMMNFISEY